MLRNSIIPACSIFLLTCGGCYVNRAVLDPWSFAPHSPDRPWTPPKNVKPMPLSDEPPGLPSQDEPYSLAELLDIALRNNQQTKITWAEARSAAATYGQSQSQFFPALTGSFTAERQRQPLFVTATADATDTTDTTSDPTDVPGAPKQTVIDTYSTLWFPQLSVSYLIYDFGTVRATSEAARQALYTADWTHNNAILTLLQTILTDFYNYLYQKQLLKADIANIETAQVTLDAAITGFDTGVRDISDILQAKTQLLQNQTTWASQQQNVETAYTTLLNAMGLPANIVITTQDLPTTLPNNDIVPPLETLITVAIQNRPDLLAAEANLRSTQQSLLAAKRNFLPKFNYTFDLARNYYNGGLHDDYNFISTFSVTMPLFQGFFFRNAIKIAEANVETAEDQMKQAELTVIQQVTSYHYNVKIAFETLQFAMSFLAAAEEQYIVAISQYKQGTNTILDVVSAQGSLVNARATQANAIQQWFVSLANLAYATGLLSPNYINPFEGTQQVDIAQYPSPLNEAEHHEENQ